jgi:acetate kinase
MIGAMIASLGGIDTLVFTGGIGENNNLIRKKACDHFSFLGIRLAKHQKHNEDRIISSSHSKINVLVIHTQEVFEIARECWKIMKLRT